MSVYFTRESERTFYDPLVFHNPYENKLYFEETETALLAGVAYSGEGVEQGCMGVDARDYDGDGNVDLAVGAYGGDTDRVSATLWLSHCIFSFAVMTGFLARRLAGGGTG